MAVTPASDRSEHQSPEPPPGPNRGRENPGAFLVCVCDPASVFCISREPKVFLVFGGVCGAEFGHYHEIIAMVRAEESSELFAGRGEAVDQLGLVMALLLCVCWEEPRSV